MKDTKAYCPLLGCYYSPVVDVYMGICGEISMYQARGNGKTIWFHRVWVARMMHLRFQTLEVIREDKARRWREALRMGADNIKTRKETLV